VKGFVDGVWSDDLRLSLADGGVLRGDGCFETMRVYRGKAFEAGAHLARLARSADALQLDLPSGAELAGWVAVAAEAQGDGVVRVVATRGSALPEVDEPAHCFVFGHALPATPNELRLLPVRAPWHGAGVDWELAGAKTLSYAPNLAAGRHSREAGFHDALLTTAGSVVLEGPTFSVAWLVDGRLDTPSLELDILDSITRRVVIELAQGLGIPVHEVVAPLESVLGADEVMALSTTKEVLPVTVVGSTTFSVGPLTKILGEAYRQRVESALAG